LKRKNIVWFLQVMVVGGVNLFSKFQMLCHLVASHERDLTVNGETSVFFSKNFMLLQKWHEAQDDLAKSGYKTNRQIENLGILLQTTSSY
jgi:hypothetical protein